MSNLQQIKTADVSTRHVTQRDTELLANADPENPAIADPYEYGFYLHVPYISPGEETLEDRMTRFAEYGYSYALCGLLRRAHMEDFALVRLDRDGIDYAELPSFDW